MTPGSHSVCLVSSQSASHAPAGEWRSHVPLSVARPRASLPRARRSVRSCLLACSFPLFRISLLELGETFVPSQNTAVHDENRDSGPDWAGDAQLYHDELATRHCADREASEILDAFTASTNTSVLDSRGELIPARDDRHVTQRRAAPSWPLPFHPLTLLSTEFSVCIGKGMPLRRRHRMQRV